MTLDNYEKLYHEILGIANWNYETAAVDDENDLSESDKASLTFIVDEILEKVQNQKHFIEMYGRLCVDLRDQCGSVIKRLLLTKCEEAFEESLKDEEFRNAEAKRKEHWNLDDFDETLHKYKMNMMNNMEFI